MSAVRAGSPALRKALRRFPGFTLQGNCGHAHLIDPAGKPVRLEDGRKLTVISSPRDDDRAAKELVRRLQSLGFSPRRAA